MEITQRIKPQVNDYINIDRYEDYPSHIRQQRINWHTSRVTAVDGDRYRIHYNDEWYTFNNFQSPTPATGIDSPPGALVFTLIN